MKVENITHPNDEGIWMNDYVKVRYTPWSKAYGSGHLSSVTEYIDLIEADGTIHLANDYRIEPDGTIYVDERKTGEDAKVSRMPEEYQHRPPTTADVTIGLNCLDCNGGYMVGPDRARREECPNCHGGNVEILDEIPEDA